MDIRKATFEALNDYLTEGGPPITDDAKLNADLGMDSLDMIEVSMDIEEKLGGELFIDLPAEFGRGSDPTVGDLIAAIEATQRGTA